MESKQYFVSKDNGLEKLKQDVNERFGNLFGGNYALKHEISNFLSNIQQHLDDIEDRCNCFVMDDKISIRDNFGQEYSIYLNDFVLNLCNKADLYTSSMLSLTKIQSKIGTDGRNELFVSDAVEVLNLSENKEYCIDDSFVNFRSYDNNGIEMSEKHFGLKSIEMPLFNGRLPVISESNMPFKIQSIGFVDDFKNYISYRNEFNRTNVDTMYITSEDYKTGQKFNGEVSLNEHNVGILEPSEEVNNMSFKPIMPESMEEIERKIANAPAELQEALRQMAPSRVNYYNNEIPTFEDPGRGVAR